MFSILRTPLVSSNGVSRMLTFSRVHTSAVCASAVSGKNAGEYPSAKSIRVRSGPEFYADNKALGRPFAPHLQIYAQQVPWVTSGIHRISGSVMAGALGVISAAILLAPQDFSHYVEVVRAMNLNPAIIYTFKFLASFLFSYHYINGTRHLAWDYALGFELPTIYKTAYIMLFCVACTSLFLATR